MADGNVTIEPIGASPAPDPKQLGDALIALIFGALRSGCGRENERALLPEARGIVRDLLSAAQKDTPNYAALRDEIAALESQVGILEKSMSDLEARFNELAARIARMMPTETPKGAS